MKKQPKTVQLTDFDINRFREIADSPNGKALVSNLRWLERWLMPRYKNRAGGWKDYPPKP